MAKSAACSLDCLDIRLGKPLILDQGNKIMALGILGIQVVTSILEETEEALEIVDTQATVGLDQLMQGRRRGISRLDREEQLDRLVADFFANHLFLVFTHDVFQLGGHYGAGS